MDIGKVIPAPGAARAAASFIVDTFADVSAVDYFSEPRFAQLRTLAAQHSWTELAAEYRGVTGVDVKTSVFAAEIVKRLHDAGKLIR